MILALLATWTVWFQHDRVEHADAERRRPDEGVDLVHHPRLVPGAELAAGVVRVLDAVGRMVAAVDPALERGPDEADRDVAVVAVLSSHASRAKIASWSIATGSRSS